MQTQLRPLAYLLLLSLVGGSVAVLSKLALRDMPAFSFIVCRLLLSAAIAYGLLRAIHKNVSWRNFKLFAPIATFWWLNALLFTFGLQRTNATTAQFIHISIPILTAICAGFLLRQKLSLRQWVGAATAAFGVSTVVLSGGSLSLSDESMVGNLIILFSAVVFSLYAVGSKLPRYKNLHAFEMVFIGGVCGTFATLPFALWEGWTRPWVSTLPLHAWLAAIGAGVVIGIFYGGFQWLINTFGPAYATLNLYLLPGFVIVWAGVLLQERPTAASAMGATIALVGVWFVTQAGRRKKDADLTPPD